MCGERRALYDFHERIRRDWLLQSRIHAFGARPFSTADDHNRHGLAVAVRDELIPVSTPTKRAKAGYYPDAYRITYDAAAKEYRVALTQLVQR